MRMTRAVRCTLGLWFAFAVIGWNVSYDHQVEVSARAFAQIQTLRRLQGLPVVTINEGFRPMVELAALRSTLWCGLVLGTGVAAVSWASRRAT